MHCEEAAHRLYEGRRDAELALHLSACDECRLLAEDLEGLAGAFARARAAWAPRPSFRVRLPLAPWKRLAVAACLLVLPLAAWALASLEPPRPRYDLGTLLAPPEPSLPPSDRHLLATLFLQEARR
jgi:hypothetical protein